MAQFTLAAIMLLVLFAALIVYFSNQVRGGKRPLLRPIAAFESLKRLVFWSSESGNPVHVSLGTGSIVSQTAADTLAGVTMLSQVTEQTNTEHVAPIVTVADPTVMLLAQSTIRQSKQADENSLVDTTTQVRWLSPNPAAYAAGVMEIAGSEAIEGNVFLGHFSDEYLLIGEAANRQQQTPTLVAGSSDPNVLPYVFGTSAPGLWGEEMYAAGAYLGNKPTHIGSLLAQDTLRWVISLVILGGIVLKTFGVFGGS